MRKIRLLSALIICSILVSPFSIHKVHAKASESLPYINIESELTKKVSVGSPADEKLIWDFLNEKIGNEFGTAGLMGNLYAESALRSDNLQNSYEKKLGYNDKEYTEAVDTGTHTKFVNDAAGYGLAQWTYWTRKKALLKYVQDNDMSIGDINAQLEFLWIELTGSYTSTLSVLKSANSVREASDYVLAKFENPADQSENMKIRRSSYGEKYYDKYAGSIELKKGDLVKITGTAYSNGKKIPQWVLDEKWYVKSVKNDRIVIDKSENGKHSIKSAVIDSDLKLIRSSETKDDNKQDNNHEKSVDELAKEVINGLWGKGAERKSKLTNAGFDYKAVQKRVNEIWKLKHN